MDALAVIQRLGTGRTLEDLVDALTATAMEVIATGKPGTVTLTLKVSNKSVGDVLVVVDETIGRTSPRKDPKGAFFWAIDGELYHNDPRQTRMEFRRVDSQTGEIREIDDDRQERRAE